MEIPMVVASGVAVHMSLAVGYFDVKVWFRCSGGVGIREEEYERLTWQEAMQAIEMALGGRQPGYELYSDGWQPSLWST